MLKSLLFTILTVEIAQTARILGIIPTPFYSHQIIFQPIWKELSLKHDVTVLTMRPMNDPNLANLTEIDTSFLAAHDGSLKEFLSGKLSIFKTLGTFIEYFMRISDDLMELDLIKSILNSTERFDLVMYELTFPIFGALCLKMSSGCVALAPFEMDDNLSPHMVLPTHSAVYMNFVFPVYKNLSFLERFGSEVYKLFGASFTVWSFASAFDARIKAHFGRNYSTEVIEKNVDMIFVNTDPVFSIKRPQLPNVVEFNGVQMKERKRLPDDLQEFISSNPNGTIFMSFGSTISSDNMDPHILKMVLETFSELPYNVLWKNDRDFENKSSNVKIIEWGPQQDILRHENTVLFINHAGLQSVNEAMHSHTPLIVLPFCGDNPRWAKMVQQLEIGIKMETYGIDKKSFKAAIKEAILNYTYKYNMQELSKLSDDQLVPDLEKVIWWTEYVLRNRGAKNLRSPILDLPWHKYYCVDVYCTMLLILFILYLLVSYTFNLLRRMLPNQAVRIKKLQ